MATLEESLIDWSALDIAQEMDSYNYIDGTAYLTAVRNLVRQGVSPEQIRERHLRSFPSRGPEANILMLAARYIGRVGE